MKKTFKVSSLLKDTLTEKDGKSYDVTRVAFFVMSLTYCAALLYHTLHTGEFNSMDAGIGMGAILGGGGGGVAIRAKMEDRP